MSYSQAKRVSKNPGLFGRGSLEGVAASESANNATTGSALIPLLVLGIPGSPSTAVLMGALIIKGLLPGRELFTVHAGITYTIIVGFLIANILMGFIGLLLSRYMIHITKVSNEAMAVVITVFCTIGAFAAENVMFGVWTMFFFGVLGYLMRQKGFHPAPIILGLILGPIAEKGLRQSLLLSHGNFLTYVAVRPISVILIILIIFTVYSGIASARKYRQKTMQA